MKTLICPQDGRNLRIKNICQVGKGGEAKPAWHAPVAIFFMIRDRKDGCLPIVITCTLLGHCHGNCFTSLTYFSLSLFFFFSDFMLPFTAWIVSPVTHFVGFSSRFIYSSQGLQISHRCIQFSITSSDFSLMLQNHTHATTACSAQNCIGSRIVLSKHDFPQNLIANCS